MNSNFQKMGSKLDFITEKVSRLDATVSGMKQELGEIKRTQHAQHETIRKPEAHHYEVEGKLGKLSSQAQEIREHFLEMQTHSMKYNLIFDGIYEREYEDNDT